ncbi:DgyrCDS12496 [Dimorphilus gyrociliatus]|uniref:DgyrCDS12496 n=1 Tax=Dimorphilus gyrociliatus TaxID=2664684 RepID=A0A7I8W8L0_9ANNE|nr:DgyrCDS12496 [Dimorphilus gyrociliatus]
MEIQHSNHEGAIKSTSAVTLTRENDLNLSSPLLLGKLEDISRKSASTRMGTFGRRLHSLFIDYINKKDQKEPLPKIDELIEAGLTVQSEPNTSRFKESIRSKFKAWARKLKVENEILIHAQSGKIVLCREDLISEIMRIHSRNYLPGDKHVSASSVFHTMDQSISMGSYQFGLSEDEVRAIVRQCQDVKCAAKRIRRNNILQKCKILQDREEPMDYQQEPLDLSKKMCEEIPTRNTLDFVMKFDIENMQIKFNVTPKQMKYIKLFTDDSKTPEIKEESNSLSDLLDNSKIPVNVALLREETFTKIIEIIRSFRGILFKECSSTTPKKRPLEQEISKLQALIRQEKLLCEACGDHTIEINEA